MAAHIERIATSISIPVIADADEGYGDIINVVRTIQLFERAGAAGPGPATAGSSSSRRTTRPAVPSRYGAGPPP